MIEKRYADLFMQGAQVGFEVAEREIVLTYVLRILDDAGLLKSLAFKGGTCLRKCVYGKETRFSGDLRGGYQGLLCLRRRDVVRREDQIPPLLDGGSLQAGH
ncbi:MAG: nucleotidyl transferase AbiEii/AbiGii toxin family protein [Elusimicrobia bacterium]|nr:nucleotidyl transferase AbiEii/AbiGii toxin family protein [Elusimicrobiota bacterium]